MTWPVGIQLRSTDNEDFRYNGRGDRHGRRSPVPSRGIKEQSHLPCLPYPVRPIRCSELCSLAHDLLALLVGAVWVRLVSDLCFNADAKIAMLLLQIILLDRQILHPWPSSRLQDTLLRQEMGKLWMGPLVLAQTRPRASRQTGPCISNV